MRKREALKLHNGDQVIDKVTGLPLRVLTVVPSIDGTNAIIEVVTAHGTYSVVYHADVR